VDSEERQLSDRERTVLLLAAEGLTDKEIAKHLNLSQRTIGTYWERMRQKLGPFSRTQLVARFLRVEGDLENSSRSYRELFSSWDEGVLIFTVDGSIIFANQAIAALFGSTLEQVQGLRVQDLFSAKELQDLRSFVLTLPQAPGNLERHIKRVNGNLVWLQLRGGPVSGARGKNSSAVLMVRDIKRQKRVNHTLDTCERTLEFVTEHSTDLIARFDDQLQCVKVNRSLLQAVGLEADALVGKSLPDLEQCFTPVRAWIDALEKSIRTLDVQSFTSEWPTGPRSTSILVEPPAGLVPNYLLTITRA
jgi:PAS domain S-box-containing protein